MGLNDVTVELSQYSYVAKPMSGFFTGVYCVKRRWLFLHSEIEMGKNPKCGFVFGSGSAMIRVRFCWDFSLMELEIRFHGGHMLWNNCSC